MKYIISIIILMSAAVMVFSVSAGTAGQNMKEYCNATGGKWGKGNSWWYCQRPSSFAYIIPPESCSPFPECEIECQEGGDC